MYKMSNFKIQTFSSPDEFVQYVADELESASRLADQHWRPQHGECPFCLLNFTVYARVEEMQEVSTSIREFISNLDHFAGNVGGCPN